MDEHRIRVFTAVARRLSFSAAARTLHLSQPAVSHQVAALERELGVRLFERTSRQVRLTPAGAELLTRSNTLLREHAEARRAVVAAEGRIVGDLAVGASLTIGTFVLPPVLARLLRQHTELNVRVRIANTEHVVNSLLRGRVDVGFIEGSSRAVDIRLHPLGNDELVVIAPAEHRFSRYAEVPIVDLLQEPFVLREEGSGTRQVAEAHLAAAGVDREELRVVAEFSGIDAIKESVAAGLGVSIISRRALHSESETSRLIYRRIEGLHMTRQMAAITLPSAPPLLAVRRLLELIRTSL